MSDSLDPSLSVWVFFLAEQRSDSCLLGCGCIASLDWHLLGQLLVT